MFRCSLLRFVSMNFLYLNQISDQNWGHYGEGFCLLWLCVSCWLLSVTGLSDPLKPKALLHKAAVWMCTSDKEHATQLAQAVERDHENFEMCCPYGPEQSYFSVWALLSRSSRARTLLTLENVPSKVTLECAFCCSISASKKWKYTVLSTTGKKIALGWVNCSVLFFWKLWSSLRFYTISWEVLWLKALGGSFSCSQILIKPLTIAIPSFVNTVK